jgi:AcrR family transcriptional regulator
MIVQDERGRYLSVLETFMNRPVRTRTDPDEVRARILRVAEEHFRRIGYHKTSVADFASELGMSPANVYRFFPSKGAINESICGRVVNEVAEKFMPASRITICGDSEQAPGAKKA